MMTEGARKKQNRMIKMGAISYAKLIKAMMTGDKTCQELADITGLHYVTVLQYTRELHREGAAHIVMWGQDRMQRDSLKIYKLGTGFDAKRFRLSDRERQRRYRARQKMGIVNERKAA
jgi:hypothetical protein